MARAAVAHCLHHDESIAVVVGGQREMFLSRSRCRKGAKEVAIVGRHKGFIRFALKFGAAVVPMFSFGETE